MIINTNKQLAATFISIQLTDNVRKTYKALAMFADFKNKTFSCYPKYETLADQVGFDRATVIHHFCNEFARGVLTEKVKIKSPLSSSTAKQVIEKQINIRSSDKPDPISNDSKMIARLVKAEQSSDPKKVFKDRGKRWFNNDDGGLYIHKRYIGQPKGLIGFVKGSVAHHLALETVAMWQDYEDHMKNGGADTEFV